MEMRMGIRAEMQMEMRMRIRAEMQMEMRMGIRMETRPDSRTSVCKRRPAVVYLVDRSRENRAQKSRRKRQRFCRVKEGKYCAGGQRSDPLFAGTVSV